MPHSPHARGVGSKVFDIAKSARLISAAALSGAAVLGSTIHGAATASGDPGKLMGMLPPGFSSSNCKEVALSPHALEKVNCDQNTESTVPTGGSFVLYGNLDDVAAGFQHAKLTVTPTCPGDQLSPGPWGYGSGNKDAGQVECGTVQADNSTVAIVVWTDKAKLLEGVVQGSDIASLYQWWKTKSG
jgi:hypothetical protein